MRIKVLIFTILALFSLSFITGCQPSDKGGKKGGKGNKITGEFAFPKLDQLKEGKFTVLGCDVTIPDKDRELLKNEYNLEPDIINVAWDEVFKRAATLVMTGESPDMVILGRGGIPYVTNNIAQKIDPYIDFSHPFYEKLKDAYEETEWGENEHYFLIRDLVKLSGMVYNAKMFEDAGLENPWEQYKNGTWDWNAFRETAKELSADSDGDGQIDVYGFGFYRPQIFAHTTGKPFGILDTKTMKITSNLRDPDIARAMNLIYDVTYKDKSGLNDSTSILDTFSRENMAMVLYDINPIRLPEVQKLV